jgi:hypothetical protein
MDGEDLYAGRFCVNWTVAVPEVVAAMDQRPMPPFVQSKLCAPFNGRVGGDLWPRRANCLDRSPEDLAASVLRICDRSLMPLLAQLRPKRGIVEDFERGGVLSKHGHIAREAYAYCLVAVGERRRATEVLEALCDAANRRLRDATGYVTRVRRNAKQSLGIELRG